MVPGVAAAIVMVSKVEFSWAAEISGEFEIPNAAGGAVEAGGWGDGPALTDLIWIAFVFDPPSDSSL